MHFSLLKNNSYNFLKTFLKYLSRFYFFCVTNLIFLIEFKNLTGISNKINLKKNEYNFKNEKCSEKCTLFEAL